MFRRHVVRQKMDKVGFILDRREEESDGDLKLQPESIQYWRHS